MNCMLGLKCEEKSAYEKGRQRLIIWDLFLYGKGLPFYSRGSGEILKGECLFGKRERLV